MSIKSEETVGNNAAIKLWLIVTTVIVVTLLVTVYSRSVPNRTVVVPEQSGTVVVPAPAPTAVTK